MFKFKNKIKEKGFTLVELIVVITILAILTVIAFVSITGYVRNSRDSKRISDIKNISSVIQIHLAKGIRPLSFANGTEESFSGGVLFKHGVIDDNMGRKLQNISKIPRDPQTDQYYRYSTTIKGDFFQILSDLELGNGINYVIAKTYADDNEDDDNKIFKIVGNYNGLFLIGSDNKYYSIPSLFIDKRGIDSEGNAWFYIDGKNKLFQHKIVQLAPSLPVSDDEIYDFTINMYNSYVGNGINDGVFLSLDITDRDKVIDFGKLLLKNKITSKTTTIPGNCNLDGVSINNGNSVTAYEEKELFWFSLNTCDSISQVRTCTDGVLDGDEKYQYSSCVKGIKTSCDADPSYITNNHTYSLPEILHQETATGIISQTVNENNGVFTYTLNSVLCNDGSFINPVEAASPTLISCNAGYTQSGSTCVIPGDITLGGTDTIICSLCSE